MFSVGKYESALLFLSFDSSHQELRDDRTQKHLNTDDHRFLYIVLTCQDCVIKQQLAL